MAKVQLNVRLEEDAAEMARQAAETRHLPVNEYVEQLIKADNEPLRERFLAGAQEVLDGYGDLLDDLESAA
ncbi:hypothetical protein [Streptomyces sp. RFCAC02]|uniref:hypothetical protein n=1 Tax=Streptomyces sp. RFCAC02 TaxID=2499143 RepID=UPI001021D677|nr:hypothetical protein [Streptomyces sp. RFCAC02]